MNETKLINYLHCDDEEPTRDNLLLACYNLSQYLEFSYNEGNKTPSFMEFVRAEGICNPKLLQRVKEEVLK